MSVATCVVCGRTREQHPWFSLHKFRTGVATIRPRSSSYFDGPGVVFDVGGSDDKPPSGGGLFEGFGGGDTGGAGASDTWGGGGGDTGGGCDTGGGGGECGGGGGE